MNKIFLVLFVLFSNSVLAQELSCPGRGLSESEIIDIVEKQRALRPELPKKYGVYETSVTRLRCLYVMYERQVPVENGIYQTFTVDPFGELMEYYVNRK
ncbi:hypothetical protein ACQE3E_01605 [Methylomonas sp. MED-D]|uniref:hypothetical protein n=1 Tax=unclassified Methylomonas TaxID=2608980 RepID=UPI0011150B95|nr:MULTISPECIES: hypothetical protein [unclassified Methylomonas]MDT4330394.1 hypothetical protein [Methylomonas sp. MV1]